MEHGFEAPDAALLARVSRSGQAESWHHGSLAVVRGEELLLAAGEIEQMVWARSAVKPLQTLPLLERGIAARLGLTPAELTILSASHGGTEEHVAVVSGLLSKAGFGEEDLLCGPHAPLDRAAALAIASAGEKPRRIHNNCSGKHAGFLALAGAMGVPPERYLEPESASQELVRQAVAAMAGLEEDRLQLGLDGCGAPTFRLPLIALARAFARLTHPEGLAAPRRTACRELLAAVGRYPLLLGGQGRLSSALVASAPGRIYAKNGAEGVFAVGVAGEGLGLAVKVRDGHERGYTPAIVEVLLALGVWPELPDALATFRRVPVYNTAKVRVGHVESALRLPWSTPQTSEQETG